MATLQELCKDVPASLTDVQKVCDRKRVEREIVRRKNVSYLHRLQGLDQERDVFYQAQTRRPQSGKFKNRVWAEQCGSVGSFVATVRTPDSYIHVVCKVKQF